MPLPPPIAPVAPVQPSHRPAIQVDLRPTRAGLNLLSAIVEGELVVRNEGELDHEFILDSQKKNAAHKNEMADMSGMNMGHNEPNRIRLAPGEDAEIIWTFANNGTFEAACLIPGHYESGMKGDITVAGH